MPTADFTIADVLAWARTKPTNERYNYSDPSNCALCQFLSATGRAASPRVDMYTTDVEGGWSDRSSPFSRHPYPREMEPALSGTDLDDIFGDEKSWTFGGLVDRLEKLCPETVVTRSEWSRLDAYLTDIEDVSRERVLS